MVNTETAIRARSLISTAIAELVEDEEIIIIPAPGGDVAHAERLGLHGSDIAAPATALGVILRRSIEASDAEA